MSNELEKTTKTRSRRSAIGGFLVLTGVAAGGVTFNRAVIQPKLEERRKKEAEREAERVARKLALKEARDKVGEHLAKSDQSTAGHIETRLKDIEKFFNKAKRGVPAFSKEMLGWGSKWKLIKDKAQFWKEETEHRTFVEEQFANHVFTSKALEKTIQNAVEDFVARDGGAVNNQFLTAVREDVPIELLDSEMDLNRFKSDTLTSIEHNFERSAMKAYGEVGVETATLIGSSIASSIAAKVLVRVATSIATRMGLSVGILATGAAASPYTLGLSFLFALIIDSVLGWAIDYFRDPEGDLIQTIQFELTKLERLIIEGAPATDKDEAVVGVRQELETIAGLQSKSRRDAMDDILDPSNT